MNILIQASPISYTGTPDKCVLKFSDQETVIEKLVKKIKFDFPNENITIISPNIPESLTFASLEKFGIKLFYGSLENPLQRIIDSIIELKEEEYIVRIDGINLFYRKNDVLNAINIAINEKTDLVKFSDDFMPSFTFDIYRVGALRKLAKLNIESQFSIHPKFYIIKDTLNFKHIYYNPKESFTDEYLRIARNFMKPIFDFKRLDVDDKKSIINGDQISFHYVLANKYINIESGRLLDLACGQGFGLNIIDQKNKNLDLEGIDLDENIISIAQEKYPHLKFSVQDALKLKFEDNYFDFIVGFEIIEHVNPDTLLKEIYRVLKPGGKLILSTPQNSLGHIPIVYEHEHEYSLAEIKNYTSIYFTIEIIFALKQGSIYFENDEIGTNSFLIAKK